MIEEYAKGRVAVFVDASNILYSQQTLNWKIDYKKLIDYFKKRTKLVSVSFYSGKVSENRKQEKFFKKIQSFGYKVVTKEVKWIKDKNGKILKGKGNLDIELALDLTHSADSYETVVLMSGDSDFEPAVSFVKNKGKKVIVISARGHISKELIRTAHKYIPFEKLKDEFMRRGK